MDATPLDRVEQALVALKNDEFFQADIKDARVKRALKHWTGVERLSSDDAAEELESWKDNYRVMQTLNKMKQIQYYCQLAGIGVPYHEIINAKTVLPSSG